MSKYYKTARGEVYQKCGILFGPEPVEVTEETLKKVSTRADMGRTIGEWLAGDKRLAEVEPPAKTDVEGDSTKPETGRGRAGRS